MLNPVTCFSVCLWTSSCGSSDSGSECAESTDRPLGAGPALRHLRLNWLWGVTFISSVVRVGSLCLSGDGSVLFVESMIFFVLFLCYLFPVWDQWQHSLFHSWFSRVSFLVSLARHLSIRLIFSKNQHLVLFIFSFFSCPQFH